MSKHTNLLTTINKSLYISTKLIKEDVNLGPLPPKKQWAAKYNPTFKIVTDNDDPYYLRIYDSAHLDNEENPPPVYRGKSNGIWMKRSDYNKLVGLKDPDDSELNYEELKIPIKNTAGDFFDLDGISHMDRIVKVFDVNGIKIPFYISTGRGKKEIAEAKHWYPFFGWYKNNEGEFESWINKGVDEVIANYYNTPILRKISRELDHKYKDLIEDSHDLIYSDEREAGFKEKQNNFFKKYNIPAYSMELKNSGALDFINQDMNPQPYGGDPWNKNIIPVLKKLNNIPPYTSKPGVLFPSKAKTLVKEADNIINNPKFIDEIESLSDDEKILAFKNKIWEIYKEGFNGKNQLNAELFGVALDRFYTNSELWKYVSDVGKTLLRKKGLLSIPNSTSNLTFRSFLGR